MNVVCITRYATRAILWVPAWYLQKGHAKPGISMSGAKLGKILMAHGSGGRLMHSLIDRVFRLHFADPELNQLADAAVMDGIRPRMAFTTDAFVVQPLQFPGGDIGKLAVCGTVNDLAASGAKPLYLSASFILEEGLEIALLEEIVISMAEVARSCGVRIVCGDTKVVGRGQCDQMFITTAGVGEVAVQYAELATGRLIRPGDHVILNGTLGDHGMAVLAARNHLGFYSDVESDCAPLNTMLTPLTEAGLNLRFMRDPTRGGLASVLCEIAEMSGFGIEVFETAIPVRNPVKAMCELFGFDVLHIANEGKMVIIAAPEDSERAISLLKQSPYGADAIRIGEVVDIHHRQVRMKTVIGGSRIISMPEGELLPRIC
ncbi:MAG: hydrogenase expression/formation protein HypE [Bacteroidales bacterium]